MSVYVDRKYLGLVSYRLERFTQKNPDLYNFRCPFCLDSKKHKHKARGYIYRKENDMFYRCHNCGISINFPHFLKEVDGTAYKQYVLERYSAGDSGHSPVQKPTFDELKGNAFEHFTNKKKELSISKLSELPEEHYAVDYILSRQIPKKFWNEIYYTDKFYDFLCKDFPDHGKTEKEVPNDDRIVLPYTTEDGEITNVAGRALSECKIRYMTIKVLEHEKKVFGTHRLDRTKPAFVVEGQFDSFFIDNCLASGDSALSTVVDLFPGVDFTIVYDNEPRNKDIVKQLARAIDKGYRVCIFPSEIEEKDINDMVRAGLAVNHIIKENTFQGASAMMRFIQWKKV